MSSSSGEINWDDYVTTFVYGKRNGDDIAEVSFWYTDRDVRITGKDSYFDEYDEITYTYNLDISLKKGWNTVYWTGKVNSSTTSVSNNPVSGLKWYFEEDFYPDYYKKKQNNVRDEVSNKRDNKNLLQRKNKG